ncbi:MAG: DegQ family serine endoprotease [Rhodospirillaceae bacterium]
MKTVSSRFLPAFATAMALVLAVPVVSDFAQAQSAQQIPMRDGIPTLAPLVEKVIPAVVNVQVKAKVSMADEQQADPFRFFNLPRGQGQMPPRERQSAGSGIIIDAKKGYILTNHHVIADATDIQVTLHDRRQLTAKMVGSDEGTDIALLQVDAKDLDALPIGDSNELRVGDYVFAVGSPFGLQKTVTSGIVSALGRSGGGIEEYEDFIQTDAAINPGNSGGPLVNLKGELVGVNTAILGPAGGNVGVGFAVPTSMVKGVIAQLQEFGEVRRGRIGVAISDITPEVAANLGIDRTEGALIGSVEKGTPADKAGIRAGDVAIEMDGKPLRGSSDLRNRIGMLTIGTDVNITVLREGQKKTFKVNIGKQAAAQLAKLPDRQALEGASFSATTRGDDATGAKVTDVEQGSPAERIGLEVGDIVTAVNTKSVKSLEEFQTAMAGSKRSTVLHVQRGDERRVIVVP